MERKGDRDLTGPWGIYASIPYLNIYESEMFVNLLHLLHILVQLWASLRLLIEGCVKGVGRQKGAFVIYYYIILEKGVRNDVQSIGCMPSCG